MAVVLQRTNVKDNSLDQVVARVRVANGYDLLGVFHLSPSSLVFSRVDRKP